MSPDGQWIAFDSDIRGDSDIYKMPLEGGSPQLVADFTGNIFAPDWSPDGTEIAFYTGREEGSGGKGEVFVVSANGGTPVQLTDSPGFDNQPDWSPDGLAIAFTSQGPQGIEALKVWIVSRDSVGMPWADPVQLTDFRCSRPDWAPDGSRVLCDAGEDMVQVSREGEVLSRYDPSTVGLPRSRTFRFSPDGSKIYFLATQEDGSRGVWWLPANGGDATKVVALDDPSLGVFRFLSVGPEDLYFTISEYESDIWVMDLEW